MSQAYRTLWVAASTARSFPTSNGWPGSIRRRRPSQGGKARPGAEEVAVGVGPRQRYGRAFFAFLVGMASWWNYRDPEQLLLGSLPGSQSC